MSITSELIVDLIAPELTPDFMLLNEAQKKIVTHEDGPIMVIAGPGSGKTGCLALRAMNLLMRGKALPQELILCTYTKKAAFEMQDRLSKIAIQAGYQGDISLIRVGTIHSICEQIIIENLHRIPASNNGRPSLGNNFKTLDELLQKLFIFENLGTICGQKLSFFINLWGTQWRIVKQLKNYFDKITEELVDISKLSMQRDYFLQNLADAYGKYKDLLMRKNCVDFAGLEKIVYDLLLNSDLASNITKGIRYVLVDEYQDTNYIQEQILARLASEKKNIFVVGDEDQSLYRFRGATAQNIRSFFEIFPDASKRRLTINYRSHPSIIEACNHWITSINWTNYRYDKKIQAIPTKVYEEYPAVQTILGHDIYDEAQQFAEFVIFLKEAGIITDYNQVALLMYSVKAEKSNPYVQALKEKGIPVFCPRAGAFFDQSEVQLMIGCLKQILGYKNDIIYDTIGHFDLYHYLDECSKVLTDIREMYTALEDILKEYSTEIAQLTAGQILKKRLADYFYSLLATEPFTEYLEYENKLQNLVIFSQLLETFQNHYHFEDIDNENKEQLALCFFNKFLSLLAEDGMNQFENPEQPFPANHVLIMTIHQAKGLEFPVVVVGSLDRKLPGPEEIDRRLGEYYQRKLSEPEDCIPTFDFMRLYYVAFSRAINLLVLTGNQHSKASYFFSEMIQTLAKWPYTQDNYRMVQPFQTKERSIAKPRYSFTSHIRMYETCPRQYQFFRANKFIPSRSADTFLGLLVHQTIEKIHRIALDGQILMLTEERLREFFEQTYYFLLQVNVRAISESDREKAFKQVEDYFYNNQFEMYDVTNAEEQIAIIKDRYILAGKVDVVMERGGMREIWDLKTSRQHLELESLYLEQYERQLCMYAHALEQRDRKPIRRLVLYWTQESLREDAIISFPYDKDKVNEAVQQFEKVIVDIEGKNFQVKVPPDPSICMKCDIRYLCMREGLIKPF
jgi:ATP-dependent DNA helicase UvrD/PcrA